MAIENVERIYHHTDGLQKGRMILLYYCHTIMIDGKSDVFLFFQWGWGVDPRLLPEVPDGKIR